MRQTQTACNTTVGFGDQRIQRKIGRKISWLHDRIDSKKTIDIFFMFLLALLAFGESTPLTQVKDRASPDSSMAGSIRRKNILPEIVRFREGPMLIRHQLWREHVV